MGLTTRLVAKGLKPRLNIDEITNEWIVRFESTIKIMVYKFVPGVEFNEMTFDGREVKVCVSVLHDFIASELSFFSSRL